MAISLAPDKHVLAVNKSEQNNINDYIKILVKIINKTFWREILTNKIYLTVLTLFLYMYIIYILACHLIS